MSDHRELLADTRRRGPGNVLLLGELEPGLLLDPGEGQLRLDRVDPAGREEDEEGAVAPGELEAVVGAGQVGVDQIGGVAVGPAHHRGLGRALDQGGDLGQAVEVGGLADVAADELDPGLLEARQVQLRAAPVEVVEREDLPIGVPGGEGNGQIRADEAGPAGDQDPRHDPGKLSPIPAGKPIPSPGACGSRIGGVRVHRLARRRRAHRPGNPLRGPDPVAPPAGGRRRDRARVPADRRRRRPGHPRGGPGRGLRGHLRGRGEAPGGDRGEPRAQHRTDPGAGRGAARRPPRGPGSRPHLHLIGRNRLRRARPGAGLRGRPDPTRARSTESSISPARRRSAGRARRPASGRGSCAARPSTASTSSPTGARARSSPSSITSNAARRSSSTATAPRSATTSTPATSPG